MAEPDKTTDPTDAQALLAQASADLETAHAREAQVRAQLAEAESARAKAEQAHAQAKKREPNPVERLILEIEAELAKHKNAAGVVAGPRAIRLTQIKRSIESGKCRPPPGTRSTKGPEPQLEIDEE